MKYVKPIDPAVLPVHARSAIDEISSLFPGPIPDPIMLHACDPELLIGHWHMSKAVYFSGSYRREYKDIIAAGVSAANACSYCLEAHGSLVALNFEDVGRAIRLDSGEIISNPEQRALFEWARSTLSPGASKLNLPDLVNNRTEIVAVALIFHYVNRLVNVMLEDSSLMIPRIPGLKKLAMLMARPVLRRLGSQTASRPELITVADKGRFTWAADDPIILSSFCNFDLAVERSVAKLISDSTQQSISQVIQRWQGESMPIDRTWVDDAVVDVERKDQPAGRLALRTALDSQRVSEADVTAYQRVTDSDADLIKLVIWSSFLATKRIGSWL